MIAINVIYVNTFSKRTEDTEATNCNPGIESCQVRRRQEEMAVGMDLQQSASGRDSRNSKPWKY